MDEHVKIDCSCKIHVLSKTLTEEIFNLYLIGFM